MHKHYLDYYWTGGIPYGVKPIENDSQEKISYKIVMDPYRKRISIEKYDFGHFSTTIYDSALLNFKHLNAIEQQSWQKTVIKECTDSMECIIRDQDDRVLFIETYHFQNLYCRKCIARSPQGILLSQQEMRYRCLGDRDNEVILFDSNNHPVMQKFYEADSQTGEFTTLIKEIRDMQDAKNQIY